MDTTYYLDEFNQAAARLDKKLLGSKQIEIAVGVILDSVFLKLYKRSWANEGPDPLIATSRIFCSIWINDETIGKSKIYYNIHALKLRQLRGYSIESRKFADAFRELFKIHEHKWPNVSVKFGPLTLMQGWKVVDLQDVQKDIAALANNFLDITYLIDDTLVLFRK